MRFIAAAAFFIGYGVAGVYFILYFFTYLFNLDLHEIILRYL